MAVVTTLPWSRPITAADLETMPDDGHRYEFARRDAARAPSPSLSHQTVVPRIGRCLEDTRTAGLRVLVAPYKAIDPFEVRVTPAQLIADR